MVGPVAQLEEVLEDAGSSPVRPIGRGSNVVRSFGLFSPCPTVSNPRPFSMSEKHKLTVVVRPCKAGNRPYQWCATGIFDFPIESRQGDMVTAVDVGSYSGWSAINRLLDQPIVTKYLYLLELEFLKENSMKDATTVAAVETPETSTPEATTQETAVPTPTVEGGAAAEAPAETADEPATTVASVLAEAAEKRVVIPFHMRRVFDKTQGAEKLMQGLRVAIDQMMAENPKDKPVSQGVRNHFHRLANVSYKLEELMQNAQAVILGREVDADGDFVEPEEEA